MFLKNSIKEIVENIILLNVKDQKNVVAKYVARNFLMSVLSILLWTVRSINVFLKFLANISCNTKLCRTFWFNIIIEYFLIFFRFSSYFEHIILQFFSTLYQVDALLSHLLKILLSCSLSYVFHLLISAIKIFFSEASTV